MRAFLITTTALLLLSGGAAQAAVSILVDKNNQQMTVSVDGVPRYTWPVSSGNPSHETPNGTFKTFRMEEDHYSKEFDDAPMPNSIFFTKQGHAIHGTDAVGRLGTPASHGCVRLSRANALKLWDLVKQEGLLSTTVTLTGSSQVALARNPKPRTNVARGDADPTGEPVQLAPQSPQNTFSEDLNANLRARRPSPDRAAAAYHDPYYDEGQPGYGTRPPEPGYYQRRIYQSRGGYQPGYGYYEQDAGNYQPQQRPRYYDPRTGQYY